MATIFTVGSRWLSYALGSCVLALAASVAVTSMRPVQLAEWALTAFGPSFITALTVLVLVTLVAWFRQRSLAHDPLARHVWVETGLHAAGGVATLALTFTLLGISLGIGTLADRPLNPETVAGIVGELTRHFSMAFMTTVVGLPLSALLRAVIQIEERRIEAAGPRRLMHLQGDQQ
ncbi:MAG: hypothetical protein HOH65_15770 [Rhodospirillaceae bacterium]|jgi:hypothetical protein|nr:hypothetical protein [Rhodospirillaceae bacterium]